MVTVILTHEVKSYPEWKKVYDADEENRKKAGVNIVSLYNSADNPNMITLIGEAPSADAVRNFILNPALKDTMTQAGVISAPEVMILNKL